MAGEAKNEDTVSYIYIYRIGNFFCTRRIWAVESGSVFLIKTLSNQIQSVAAPLGAAIPRIHAQVAAPQPSRRATAPPRYALTLVAVPQFGSPPPACATTSPSPHTPRPRPRPCHHAVPWPSPLPLSTPPPPFATPPTPSSPPPFACRSPVRASVATLCLAHAGGAAALAPPPPPCPQAWEQRGGTTTARRVLARRRSSAMRTRLEGAGGGSAVGVGDGRGA